jgi:hypothetical protein
MKKAFFPILVLVLGVICGCEKTIDFGDEDPDGYWYMSSIQMKAEDATGKVITDPVAVFSEIDSPKFIKVSGTSFVPYYDHARTEYDRLSFTGLHLYAFQKFEDYDKAAESLVDYTADADKITLTGRATVDYWRDASGNPQDWNMDGIINREDVAVASGVLPGEVKVSNLGSLPLELPYTLSFTLQFTRTDLSHFEAWYTGE